MPEKNNKTAVDTEVAQDGFTQGVVEALPSDAPPETKSTGTQPRMFSEAEVQKLRQDEKSKVYGELTQAQDALRKYQEAEATRVAADAKAQADAAAEAQAAREAEMDAKQLLEARDAEWTQRHDDAQRQWEDRFNQINLEREQERAIAQKERELFDFQQYRTERLQAESGNIAPELIDLVYGNTREELDASIIRLKEKSEQIAQTVQHYAAQARAGQRGVSAASFPTAGPDVETQGGQPITAEDIANMSVEQYAEFRQKVGIGSSSSNKGMFG
jgi:hypothetical protein